MLLGLVLILSLSTSDFSQQLSRVKEVLNSGDIVAADQAAHQLAKNFPSRPAVHHVIGIIRLRQGRRDEAESEFRQALVLDSGHSETWLELGRLYQSEGRLVDARNTLQEGLSKAGPDPPLLVQLARVLAKTRHLDEAIQVLKRVPESGATADYWETRGQILATVGDLAGSERAYKKLLEIRPGSIPVLRALSGLALKQGDKERSWDYIAAARAEAPNSPDVLYDFAQVSWARFLLAEAISTSRLLLLLEPDNLDALFLLGRTFLSGDQAENAQKVFEEYLQSRPKDPKGHLMMGIALFKAGKFDAAGESFQAALKLDPKLMEAEYYLGMVAYSLADDERAERILLSVVERDPNQGHARLGLGKLYLRQKKLEQAVAQLQTASRLLSDDSNVHFQLSRAYAQLGKSDLAREEVSIYRELLEKDNQKQEAAAEMPFTLKDRKP